MKKILAFILVIVMLVACCCQAEEQEKVKKEVTLKEILDSVDFETEEDKSISREIIKYLTEKSGKDVYFTYSFYGALYVSIGGAPSKRIPLREGIPDEEFLDSILVWEDSSTYEPLGYFTAVEAQEVLTNCFLNGTHLRATFDEEGMIIRKEDVPVTGTSLLIGPDGELYARKLDIIYLLYFVGC